MSVAVVDEEQRKPLVRIAKVEENCFMLWVVDADRAQKRQVLKVWNIVGSKDKVRATEQIQNTLVTYSRGHLDHYLVEAHEGGKRIAATAGGSGGTGSGAC